MGGHRGQVGEPALTQLLAPAGFIEFDRLYPYRVLEIGNRRIVEGDVAVFTDTDASDVHGMALQQRLVLGHLPLRIWGIAIDQVNRCRFHLIEDTLFQVLTEAGRMMDG